MKRQIFILMFCLLCLALPAAAQKGVNGTWEWKGTPDKNRSQNVVWLDIKQTGSKVKGGITIWAVNPDEGEEGADSPLTPFIGTVVGKVITIEFDAEDVSPLDGTPVKYVRRKGGAPNTATLRLVGGKLEFTQTKGSMGEGYPRKFTLSR